MKETNIRYKKMLWDIYNLPEFMCKPRGLNIKEKIATTCLVSGASAAILCGFTISVSWGLGAAAGVLIGVSLLTGYEG